jgi:CheY-like chemotaxis protein
MNAIIGLGKLLLQTPLNAQQRDYQEKVLTASESLLGVINDILDYSRIEAGKLKIEQIPFDLDWVLRNVHGQLALKAQEKGLDFRVVVDQDVPRGLGGDPLRLSQIILNLASNALKFTERGAVTISVTQRMTNAGDTLSPAASPESVGLQFTVRDSGIGIPPERLGDLFSPFVQMDGSITRRFGGSGLGLAICKQLTDMMGGRVVVESRVGEGSCFQFFLPFTLAPEAVGQTNRADQPQGAGAYDFRPIQGARVLLVDDVRLNREVALAFLAKTGVQVDTALNGLEAVCKVRSTAYDLVLMDIQMPEMDGLSATREIREDACFADLPILAMTAHAMTGDRERSLAAGMNDHLTKPISPEVLFDALLRWIKPRQTNRDRTQPTVAPEAIEEQAASAIQGIPALDGIDIERGLVNHLHDPELYHSTLSSFTDEFGTTLSAAATAVAATDYLTARRLLHTLKSVAATIGAHELSAAAKRLEDAYAAGRADHEAYAACQAGLQRVLASLTLLPAASPPLTLS